MLVILNRSLTILTLKDTVIKILNSKDLTKSFYPIIT